MIKEYDLVRLKKEDLEMRVTPKDVGCVVDIIKMEDGRKAYGVEFFIDYDDNEIPVNYYEEDDLIWVKDGFNYNKVNQNNGANE